MPRKAIDRGRCFLFYPADYLSDPAVLRMGVMGRGAYAGALLPHLWNQPEPGVVEADDELLALLAMCSGEEWAAVKEKVSRAFDLESRPGFWVQKRMVSEHAEQQRVMGDKKKLARRAAGIRWKMQPQSASNAEAMQNDAGSGSGSGSGSEGVEEEAEASPKPPRSGGLTGASAPGKANVNGSPRQRGTNPRARGETHRRPWTPRKWYGEQCTQAVAADYTPPGPISISPGGRRGIELPGGEWRPFTPDELNLWQAAVIRASGVKH